MVERLFIRILVAVALCLAFFACALTPVPVDRRGEPDLPAPAFEQVALYRLEVALITFYGYLLLVTPACSGLLRGRLPIEISTKGAKFATETDVAAANTEAAIKSMERATRQLAEELEETQIELQSLRKVDAETVRNQR